MKYLLLAVTFSATLCGIMPTQAARHPIQQNTCDNNGRCFTTHVQEKQSYKKIAKKKPSKKRIKYDPPPDDTRFVDRSKLLPLFTTIRSTKTGATARVDTQYAAKFQAYVNSLEDNGATVYSMGGWRRGRCSLRHLHSCGGGQALDVCQLSRGRVSPKCNLPGPAKIAKIAAAHGLFEGALWCNSDYGHAQAKVSSPSCGPFKRVADYRNIGKEVHRIALYNEEEAF